MDRHDREIAAIRKLVLTGMKMLVRLEQSQRETDRLVQENAKQLQVFIRSLRERGRNGHVKRRVH